MTLYKHRINHIDHGMLGVYFVQKDNEILIKHSFDSLTGSLKGTFVIQRQNPETQEWIDLRTITK